jgi:hypothetical protein
MIVLEVAKDMRASRLSMGLAVLALASACRTAPPAGARAWEFLGKREVEFHVDHDVIEVGRAEGRFDELRFVVRGGDIEMYKMRVTLGDGDVFSPENRLVLEKGEGRILRLPGEHRVVRRVEFVYRSLRGNARRATVSLFGR